MKDEVNETDFEEARKYLLKSYEIYVQDNVSYMIVIMICSIGLILTNEFFLKIIYGSIFIFLGAIILMLYSFLRLSYWAYHARIAEFITKKQALRLFDTYTSKTDSPFLEKASLPFTSILQIAIKCQLRNLTNDSSGYWLSRYIVKIVLKTGS